jgi:hypothetical protein
MMKRDEKGNEINDEQLLKDIANSANIISYHEYKVERDPKKRGLLICLICTLSFYFVPLKIGLHSSYVVDWLFAHARCW